MKDREQWLKQRTEGLGGSDMGAVLGVNPYKNAVDVWRDKMGLNEFGEEPERGPMARGNAMEALIDSEYQKRTGRKTAVLEKTPIRHPQTKWWMGSPDRWQWQNGGEKAILEIKAYGLHNAAKFNREGPDPSSIVQVNHYMGLTNLKRATIATINYETWDILYYDVDAEPVLIKEMAQRGDYFWNEYVVKQVEPPADELVLDAKQVPKSDEKKIITIEDRDFVLAATLWHEGKGLEGEAKAMISEAKERMTAVMERLDHWSGLEGRCESGEHYRFYEITKKGSQSFDWKKFKKDHPDVWKEHSMDNWMKTNKGSQYIQGYALRRKGDE